MTDYDPEASRERIRQALESIRHSAQDDKEILMNLMEDEFADLRAVFGDRRAAIADKIQEQRERIISAKDESVEQVKRIANRVDHYVHREPWWVLGASAAGALLIGYLLGRDRS
jgi:ElaB/YqjD/DUF883 family membrane-anchored ribosome-binding protein